jgi:fatty acid desaturase
MIASLFALGTRTHRALKCLFHLEDSRPYEGVIAEDSPFLKKLCILYILVAIFGSAVYLTPYPVKFVPQFLLGSMYSHAVELLHELLHRKRFLKQHRYQVTLMLGLPMLVSPSLYNFLHRLHHKYLGTPLDTESFSYDYEQITTIKGFILHVSMIKHYLAALKHMLASVFDKINIRDDMPFPIKTLVKREFRLMAVYITIMVIFSVVCKTTFFLDIWLIPLIFGAGPVHALLETPEHIGCNNRSTNVFKNTRSIEAGTFAEWFTNSNCFHSAHHLNAGWEISQLREHHNQIAENIENLEKSYWAFYGKLLREILRNSLKLNF